jgi:hypothetical protein
MNLRGIPVDMSDVWCFRGAIKEIFLVLNQPGHSLVRGMNLRGISVDRGDVWLSRGAIKEIFLILFGKKSYRARRGLLIARYAFHQATHEAATLYSQLGRR